MPRKARKARVIIDSLFSNHYVVHAKKKAITNDFKSIKTDTNNLIILSSTEKVRISDNVF